MRTPEEARLDDVRHDFYQSPRVTVEQRAFIRDSLIGLLPESLVLTKISDEHGGMAHGRSRNAKASTIH